jgi:serine/threonine-protein kinase HipA
MSSRPPPTGSGQCFVYVQLPATLQIVTAGRYQLESHDGVPVGRFVYGRSYRENAQAVPLDPFDLPIVPRTFETARMRGIFGALRDASPDSWGRSVIEKQLKRTELSEIDYLLHSPEDRAGALSFGLHVDPPGPVRRFNRVLQLEALLREADRYIRDAAPARNADPAVAEQVQALVNPGTSLGGARPKNVVEDEDGLWVAKFPHPEDRWNQPRVEGAMLALALECGIRVAQSRVLAVAGRDVLLVKRFDREKKEGGYHRHRMVSGLTVLRAEDSHRERERWSYPLLADELKRWSHRPDDDLRELFRRVAFSALVSNTDDHPRNHALIAPGQSFELSPAYDIAPMPHVSLERRDLAMTIGKFGRYANRANLLSSAGAFRLSKEEAAAVFDALAAKVKDRWYATFRREGVSERDCEAVSRAFVYEGLFLDPSSVSPVT